MVDYKKYFAQLKKLGLQRPISQHFEYDLGGAQSGAAKPSIPKEDVIKAFKTDLATLKTMLREAGL
ncbi:hypothetical protein HK413_13395 [Mucilaginibacter sp. S1162]|uniref:Uncharacterized protein n=1 Tax=Mucilaginibacter humi TaxID=2732510 RepID=A0ABX1W7B2_9SPHI|nr:hypothetical protein [Mucilaginibacter humi]NNU34801.1 hypothetical protein [Mucilaginibacter humi]